jgi:WD40 repeat protein
LAERTVPAQDAAPAQAAATGADTGPPESPAHPVAPSGLIRRPDPRAVTTPAEFTRAFTALRQQSGISVRDLARTVGSTSETIGEYFTEGRLPPVSATGTVEKILTACGVAPGSARQTWIEALSRVRRMPGPRHDSAPVPYRGLESYRIEDATCFFGREKLVARLVALVMSAASAGPTMLVGPAGSGKSSALAAGLAARLRGSGNWEVSSFTPGDHPLASLDRELASIRSLKLPPGSRVAVIVDQFEEIFTLCSSEEERSAFVDRLASPLTPGPGIGPAATVVIGLRADFYGAALRYEALGHALQDRQIVVGPMSGSDLRRAVTEPARAAGIQLDPGLAEMVVHENGELPLLSYALLRTLRRGEPDRLTLEDYIAVGGASAAVQTAAEAVYAELTGQQRELARSLFVRLVVVDDRAADARRRVTATDLGLDRPEGDATSEVIERFVSVGLLTTGERTVEIAHETIIAAWPRLSDWVSAEHSGLLTRRTLADAALQWDRDGRGPQTLLRGPALSTAREWAQDPHHLTALNDVERAFLAAGTRIAEREKAGGRRRTLRSKTLLASVSALAIATSGLAGAAAVAGVTAAGDRDDALSRQLAATARQLRRTDPSIAGQVAVLAWKTSPTAEARSALIDTSAAPIARRVDGPGGPATVAVSAGGRVLAAAGEDGALRIWTLGTGATPTVTEAGTVPGGGGKALHAVALNPEGTVAVAAGTSGVLYGWDLRKPGRPGRLPEAPLSKDGVLTLAFSANGHTLAAGTGDGRIVLYDVRPGSGAATLTAIGRPLTVSQRPAPVRAVALSADSMHLAATGGTGRVQLWTLADRARPRAVPAQATAGGTITSLAFSDDGHRLVAGSTDRRAYLWQVASPGTTPLWFGGSGGGANAVALSPDGAHLAVGGSDDHLRVYETATRQQVADLPHSGPVTTAAYLGDGTTLVTGSADGVLRLWPVPGPVATMTTGETSGLGYLGSGRLAATTSRNALRVFDVSRYGRPSAAGGAVKAPGGAALTGAMASDRTRGVIAAGGTDGSVWLYRGTRFLSALSRLHDRPVISAAFSADGKTLVTASADGVLRVIDVADPAKPLCLSDPVEVKASARSVAISPDARTLAVGAGGPSAVTLWDLGDRKHPARLADPLAAPGLVATSVAFDADGTALAVGSKDRTVRLVNLTDRTRPSWLGEPLTAAEGDITDVAFSPDGGTLAAAGENGDVRLWDVSDGAEPAALGTLTANGEGALYTVAFDPDAPGAGRLAAAGASTSIRQWDLDPDAAVTRVCSLAGAPLNRADWAKYVPGVAYGVPCQR